MDETTLNHSLRGSFGNKFTMGRYFTYKNQEAFSQVIEEEEDTARSILSKPSPSIQLGHCFFPIDIFVPIVRCFKYQAYGHTATACLNKYIYCTICGHKSHSSKECKIKTNNTDNYACITVLHTMIDVKV